MRMNSLAQWITAAALGQLMWSEAAHAQTAAGETPAPSATEQIAPPPAALPQDVPKPDGEQTSPPRAEMAPTDEEFLKNTVEMISNEREFAKLASERATSEEVKSLGQELLKSQAKNGAALDEVAKATGVSLNPAPGSTQMDAVNSLREKEGAEFDNAFRAQLIENHAKSLQTFATAARRAKDPKVKAFALEALGELKKGRPLLAAATNESAQRSREIAKVALNPKAAGAAEAKPEATLPNNAATNVEASAEVAPTNAAPATTAQAPTTQAAASAPAPATPGTAVDAQPPRTAQVPNTARTEPPVSSAPIKEVTPPPIRETSVVVDEQPEFSRAERVQGRPRVDAETERLIGRTTVVTPSPDAIRAVRKTRPAVTVREVETVPEIADTPAASGARTEIIEDATPPPSAKRNRIISVETAPRPRVVRSPVIRVETPSDTPPPRKVIRRNVVSDDEDDD